MPALTRISASQKNALKAPLRVVSIGGGTGLSTLLSGLEWRPLPTRGFVVGVIAALLACASCPVFGPLVGVAAGLVGEGWAAWFEADSQAHGFSLGRATHRCSCARSSE